MAVCSPHLQAAQLLCSRLQAPADSADGVSILRCHCCCQQQLLNVQQPPLSLKARHLKAANITQHIMFVCGLVFTCVLASAMSGPPVSSLLICYSDPVELIEPLVAVFLEAQLLACSLSLSAQASYLLLEVVQQVLVVEGLCRVSPQTVPAVPRLCGSLSQKHPLIDTQVPVRLNSLSLLILQAAPAAAAVAPAAISCGSCCCSASC
jgi:hypothetical protein